MNREVKFMMDVAHRVAEESRDLKTKVGCVIAKDRNILAYGYNGTPAGYDNTMRDENLKTLPTVIHAEQNALAKLARSTQSGEGAVLYCTLLPCMSCALSLVQAGISEVYYSKDYKDSGSLEVFAKLNIKTTKVDS
jgi:dCMP deaminase